MYSALQFMVNKQYSYGLTFMGNYRLTSRMQPNDQTAPG